MLHEITVQIKGAFQQFQLTKYRVVVYSYEFYGNLISGVCLYIMAMHNPPHPIEIIKEFCIEPLTLTVTQAAESPGVTSKPS